MHLFILTWLLLLLSATSLGTVLSPLLWKAEKNGEVAYLFGTLHKGFSLSDFPAEFLEILDQSATLLTETDLSFSENELMEMGMYSNGQTLKQQLSEDSWEKLVEVMGITIPEEKLQILKPWVVYIFVNKQIARQLNLEGALDLEVQSYAQKRGITVGHLEENLLQASVFEKSISASFINALFKEYDEIVPIFKKNMLELYNCYRASDVSCLIDLTGKISGSQYDTIAAKRNKAWISTIKDQLKSGQLFVAVGCAHLLLGGSSVLELLKQDGFSVQRVQLKGTEAITGKKQRKNKS